VGGDAGVELEAIEYASVVTVTLAYPPMTLDGSGFLVPRVEGRLLTACTWTTAKWGLAPSPRTFLRASAGRLGDERAMQMDDDELVARLHEEISTAMDVPGPPEAAHVTRWPRSFPQYDVGHAARVVRIDRALPPGVFVAGAAYQGPGIAACIRQAAEIAAGIVSDEDRRRSGRRR
jgi:oxygen-dependent protoporphyrinogen oxidase